MQLASDIARGTAVSGALHPCDARVFSIETVHRRSDEKSIEVIFTVPLDVALLDRELGTGQEHRGVGGNPWAGRSHADRWD